MSKPIVFEYDLDDITSEMVIYAQFIDDWCCEAHHDFALAKMNFLVEAEQLLGHEDEQDSY